MFPVEYLFLEKAVSGILPLTAPRLTASRTANKTIS
jgi:hypothetical protein